MKPSVAVSDSQHWVMWLYLLPQLSYQTSTWLQLLDITAASTAKCADAFGDGKGRLDSLSSEKASLARPRR